MTAVPRSIIYRVAGGIEYRVRDLRMEVRTRSRALRISALIGIYGGGEHVGRKTLACRLAHMNRKTIRRVPEIAFFTGSYIGWFNLPFIRNNPFNRVKFILTFYIDEPPFRTYGISTRSAEYYYDFIHCQRLFTPSCCIIYLFDIVCRNQFEPTLKSCEKLKHKGIVLSNYPTILLVGNKCDMRGVFPEEDLQNSETAQYPGYEDQLLPPEDNPDPHLLPDPLEHPEMLEFSSYREVNFSEDSRSTRSLADSNSADGGSNYVPITLLPFDTMLRRSEDKFVDYFEVSAKYKQGMIDSLFDSVLLAAYKHTRQDWDLNDGIE